jgi:sodium-coupled neutral amino acid transporter 11
MPPRFRPAPQAGFPRAAAAAAAGGALGYVGDLPPFYAGRGLLVLMNMCCVAYACHYNAVKYYMELRDRTVPNLKSVMMYGIGGTALVFWCMMVLGYATFGSNSQALLLNNYHGSQDAMATVARAFTGIAIISGYALMFAGLKAALFSLTGLDRPSVPRREAKQRALSAALLALIAAAACFVTEHELATVIGIVGSVIGSVVIYMFPAFVNNSLLKMKDKKGNNLAEPFFKGEALFNKVMVAFGAIFAVLGTWITIATAEH